jgi:hypothetical protein
MSLSNFKEEMYDKGTEKWVWKRNDETERHIKVIGR